MQQDTVIGLVTPLMAAVFTAVFAVLWKRGRMGSYVLAFAGAFFFFGVGVVASLVTTDEAVRLLFPFGHLCFTAASACVVWGAVKRVGETISLAALGYIYAVALLGLTVAMAVSDRTESWIYLVNTGYGVIFALGTITLMGAPRRSAIDSLMVALFALTATQFLTRPAFTFMVVGGAPASEYHQSFYYSVLNVAVIIQALVIGVTLVLACTYDQVMAERERGLLDLLTGLRTRRAFEQDALAAMERAKGEGVPVSLIVADLDHFKGVNDVYGHQAGDHAIAAFGAIVAQMIRNSDVAGRIGGEEFCILAWNCDAAQADAMAERIRRRFAESAITGMPADMRLTASFGVAGRLDGEGYGKLFARADAELYRAKDAGRNCVRLAGEGNHTVTSLDLHRGTKTCTSASGRS